MILNTLHEGEVEVVDRTFFPAEAGGGVSTVWKFLSWWDMAEGREPLVRADSINDAITTLRWMERGGDVKRVKW